MRRELMRTPFSARCALAVAAAGAALLVLSGCEEQPYPNAANNRPPPAQAQSDLMGAPTASAPPATADGPPPAAPPSQPYDQGAVVAMTPIPNPGDPGSEPYYGVGRGRVHHRYQVAPGSQHAAVVAVAAPPASPSRRPPAPSSRPPAPSKAPQRRPAPQVAPAAGPADQAARLAALQAGLTSTLAKEVTLAGPPRFAPNEPADVTLTAPSGFVDDVRTQAQTQGLGEAASSASLTAVLAGDGYTVLPAGPETGLLMSGQATKLHWTATAKPGARGPLKASVSLNLLGGGSSAISLGSLVLSPAKALTPTLRAVGVGLLVLIGLLVIAWLARGEPSGSELERRAAKQAARGGRPLNMGQDPPAN